jgi:hypothetical protein
LWFSVLSAVALAKAGFVAPPTAGNYNLWGGLSAAWRRFYRGDVACNVSTRRHFASIPGALVGGAVW